MIATVGDLIEELKQHDPNVEVFVITGDKEYGRQKRYIKKTAKRQGRLGVIIMVDE